MIRCLALACIAAACRSSEPPASPTQRLHEAAVALRERPDDRRAIERIAELCCFTNLDEACPLLATIFERHAIPLDELVLRTGETCLNRIPDAVTEACNLGCSPEEKRWLLSATNSMDPSAKIMEMSFAFLESSFDPLEPGYIACTSERDAALRTPQEQVRDEAVQTIARLGDEELEKMATWLAHKNPRVRIELLRAFDEAVHLAPVHSPVLENELVLAHADHDERVAEVARGVSDAYLTQARHTPRELLVERLPLNAADAIRILAVRRFACFAPNAEAILAAYAASQPRYRPYVEHAIVLRRRRCAKYPEARAPE